MKYGAILVTAVLLPVGVYGQTAVSPSIQVGSVSEAPESSIDLLQKSIRTSGSTVAGVGRPAPKQKPKKEVTQTVEPVQPPVAEKAKSAPVATVSETAAETKDSAAANKTATVEKTTIAPAATTPKAPAVEKSMAKTPAAVTPAMAVAPAEGPVSSVSSTPATAPLQKQPLPSANVRPNVPVSATRPTTPAGAKPTSTEKQIEQGNALLPQNAPAAPSQPSAQDLQVAEQAADAELEYAVKMLEASKAKAHGSRR
ncbi:MAG: hypothetical protein MJ053_05100, partial [Elusimicrobiaceae bacterium]|nr:hypothetical protein [Elusimicrobiaceae bacterium]